ncbi:Protein of unknown function [Lentibacillus halodurans]|uniref:DUF2515 domain-containing protein n=1 Tax=Lentibacillus halodurans TaxID=237679 RepID=A0A1I0VDG2_9BACI|nr:DUF2515 family protein [Lentibacillus halodurans]SFA74371.1 Protein of unknown function [Lentibacillus halodurans]
MVAARGKADHLHYIIFETNEHNLDNISRTKAYQNFYMAFPEIKWAFVASMVSRNAGWNMTDLWLSPLRKMLSNSQRKRLFMTYERANWLIFSDAYPQLLVYQLSLNLNKPLFHLFPELNVSRYMQQEWELFWEHHDKKRLLLALIINEQNVIQRPVINQDYFKYRVFWRPPYLLQDILLLNAIIIPTKSNRLYGAFVHDFTNIDKRIALGKKIASIMFHPRVYDPLLKFARSVEHTGSRWDYEKFLNIQTEKAPLLRMVYPVITHQDIIRKDWYRKGGIKHHWTKYNPENPDPHIKQSFYNRRKLMYVYYHIKDLFM